MKKMIMIFFLSLTGSLSAESVSGISDYPAFCKIAAEEPLVFQSFKRQAVYRSILEHVSDPLGQEYLKIIEGRYPFILNKIEECKENDFLGDPMTCFYGDRYGYLSPTTLRYMKVAGDIIHLFGSLEGKEIVEIGGGYGGQCKIISSLAKFGRYTIIDLPEACLLTRKYLRLLGVNDVTLFDNKHLPIKDSYDLVISNYAFSEVGKIQQIQYIEKIINRSKAGYMTCNFISDIFNIESLTLDEILVSIKRPNRKVVVLPEEPDTLGEDVKGSCSKTVIITWTEEYAF